MSPFDATSGWANVVEVVVGVVETAAVVVVDVVVVAPPDAPESGSTATAVSASAPKTTVAATTRPSEVRILFISCRPLVSIIPTNIGENRARRSRE
jgi:hypothetical protein